ncbi:MAG: FtsX-like permease family protein, partial [Actinomycetota bacterium]
LRGRLPTPGAPDEALVDEGFAKAHELEPGEMLAVTTAGRRSAVRVTGVAGSPEWVFAIRPGDLLPDPEHFAVLWMDDRALAARAGYTGAFNDLAVRLVPGASLPDTIARVDRILAPYGGRGAFGRDLHVSHRFLSDEFKQLAAMAVILPAVFLGVAAFLLNVVVSRLVATQREQISALRAFGVSGVAIGVHYAKLVGAVAVVGSVIGAVGGHRFGTGMTALYGEFYHLPTCRYLFEPWVPAVGLGVSLLAALLGVVRAVSRAVSVPPAEGMRPEAPPTYRRTLVERLGAARILGITSRMILRNLGRRPSRAVLSTLGLSMAVAVVVVGGFMDDSMSRLMDLVFLHAERQDVTLAFDRPLPRSAEADLRRLPGVRTVETFRATAVRIRHGHRSRWVALTARPTVGSINRVVDRDGRVVRMPAEGVVLSAALGKLLEVQPGDTVELEFLEGTRRRRPVRVAALVDDLIGVSAFMATPALARLMEEPESITRAWLRVDPERIDELQTRLREAPAVSAVVLRSAILAAYRKMIVEAMTLMTGLFALSSVLIAVGVVYNAGRVSLAERERELASLRVLGLRRGEVSAILLGELALLTVLALPIGMLLGQWMAHGIAVGMTSDLYRIPAVLQASTYGWAALVVLAAGAVTALAIRRRLDRLDLVEVLKTRE